MEYQGYRSDIISIGSLTMGGDLPVRVQSMTSTDTNDVAASVSQSIRIIEAGGELVRLTAQGVREAASLAAIKRELRQAGFTTPLCADIHFNPAAAEEAARIVEKVRINPGNYADRRASFIKVELTDGEYRAELERTRERLLPLIRICSEYGTAIRIGVNHGSLSDRIMTRYGNTPEGMAISAIEFLEIFRGEGFGRLVVSMKSSDTLTMVLANRLLVKMMEEKGMHYPIHLGITEAGEGEDGRIISAAGMGTLLTEGIGDTIRVSLSEPPEAEIPVAKAIIATVGGERGRVERPLPPLQQRTAGERYHPQVYTIEKNPDHAGSPFAEKSTVGTGSPLTGKSPGSAGSPLTGKSPGSAGSPLTGKSTGGAGSPLTGKSTGGTGSPFAETESDIGKPLFIDESGKVWEEGILTLTASKLLSFAGNDAFDRLLNPIFGSDNLSEGHDATGLAITAATLLGRFFIARQPAGIAISNRGRPQGEELKRLAFSILQATEARITRTRYISCPTCGRTRFNLPEAVRRVKTATAHLTGLKIAIMGCVVNGPGEMAGADYGYVGAGAGKVNIYRGTEAVYRNVPEEEAPEKLLALINSDQAAG